jgi:beta-lactamase regulating signal transducer with metallopeptidase domain
MNIIDLWVRLDPAGFASAKLLLAMLWQSSILLAAIAGMAWLLRNRHATVRRGLWMAGLLASPLLPFVAAAVLNAGAPQAPVRVLPAYVRSTALRTTAGKPADVPRGGTAVSVGSVGSDRSDGLTTTATPVTQANTPAKPFSALDYPWSLALAGYAAGLAGFLGWIGLGRARIRRWIRSSSPVTDERALGIFKSAKRAVGLSRSYLLLSSRRVSAPMSYGISHPVVLLPEGLAERLPDDELKALAIHELAHVKRNDSAALLAAALVRAVLFFHPLVWVGARRVSALSEEAADNAVLAASFEPIPYAKLLARLAEELPWRALSTELASGILFTRGAFLRRIETILSDERERLRRLTRIALAGTVLGLLVSVGVALAVPLGEKRDALVAEAGSAGSGGASAVPEGATASAKPNGSEKTTRFVRIATDGKVLTFEGKETTWKELDALLAETPDRSNTVLEVGISTESMTLRQQEEATVNAARLASQFGFKYLSYVGTQGLGTKGSPAETLRRVRVVTDGEALTLDGEKTTWDDLSKSLEELPDRPNTIVEFAMSSADFTVALANESFARVRLTAAPLGFKEVTDIGVRPLGSKAGAKEQVIRIPPPFSLAEFLISAFDRKNAEEAAWYCVPGYSQITRDMGDWTEMRKINPDAEIRPVTVCWSEDKALVFTNVLKGDPRTGDMALAFSFVSRQENGKTIWGLDDVDMVKADGIQKKMDSFKGEHPGSVEWSGPESAAAQPSDETSDTVTLGYVDDTAESQRSLGASGHGVLFARPEKARFVEAVQMFGSRYGVPEAPDEDFHLYLLNDKYQVIADVPFPYSMVERGDMKWYTLETPAIEVPENFVVALAFNPHQTKGIYLGLDENVKETHSLVGLPDEGYEPWAKGGDWMVRVRMTEQPSAGKEVKRLADWKPPAAEQPLAGSVEMKYDNGKSGGMQSYGGSGPAIRFKLDEFFPSAGAPIVPDGLKLKGFRLYGSRYGSGYNTATTMLKVLVLSRDGKVLREERFPYGRMSYQPRWIDLALKEPLDLKALASADGTITIAFDPAATQTKGVYFHYSQNPSASHSMVWNAQRGVTPLPDREWMIRAVIGTAAGAR